MIIPAGAGKRGSGDTQPDAEDDHPRGCGEKGLTYGIVLPPVGSSPRVRGKESDWEECGRLEGIIPAGAGKSLNEGQAGGRLGDHPRGCGEKVKGKRTRSSQLGSSPRVRGKGEGLDGLGDGRWIIPAGAGKSLGDHSHPSIIQDHPRGCGEKGASSPRERACAGSSPRVRGKDKEARRGGALRRIIPAGAGKSLRATTYKARRWDHPRGCGEKRLALATSSMMEGSSPRVRGKASRRDRRSPASGIIPAGAGKRVHRRRDHGRRKDHPRGCGEKRRTCSGLACSAGSSPRVRGKDRGSPHRVPRDRIIPAGAGKSPAAGLAQGRGRDHPRGCGEKRRR